jgi:hypothetical protein
VLAYPLRHGLARDLLPGAFQGRHSQSPSQGPMSMLVPLVSEKR